MDGKELSKMIRDRKKGRMVADLDDAGPEGLPPEKALSAELNAKVNEVTSSPDHEPASATEMGEGESSQEKGPLKKSMARISAYLNKMGV
jgi:hypothetical protein